MFTRSATRTAGAALILFAALLGGCGDDTTEPEPADGGRSAEEVAALLVTPEALGDGWSVMEPPGEEFNFEDGIVTDENRDYLPRVDLCPTAGEDAAKAVEGLDWQAFEQLNYDTGMDETTEPTPGVRPEHHLVFMQEFLLSDDETAVTQLYDDLAAGVTACSTQQTTSPDGEEIVTAPMEAPDLGDAAVAVRTTVTEPGGGGSAVWDLRTVFFRDGDLLVGVTIAEIATPKIERILDEAAITEILEAVEAALS